MKLSKDQAIALNLKLSGYKGEYVGFFHTGGNPVVRGYWERKDGSEGGELRVDSKTGVLLDYDGAYDLPGYVYSEIETLGIKPSHSFQLERR